MKSLILVGERELEYRDSPDPEPADGEALVKIAACGICGSDMHAYLGHDPRRPPPLILGHEAAGEVVEGKNPGARVAINPLVVCGRSDCKYCSSGRDNLCPDRQILSMPPRPGAFAEYACAPEENLIPLPDGFPYEKAALFEPLACGYHAARYARELSRPPAHEMGSVVIGGGAIGLGSALILATRSSAPLTLLEANPLRWPALKEAVEHLPHVSVVAPADAPERAGIIIDAVGSASSRETAFGLAAPGSAIVHIGLASGADGVDSRKLTLQEIVYCGTYTYTKSDFEATAQMCINRDLGDLGWPQVSALDGGADVFRLATQNEIAAPKVVLSLDARSSPS